MDDHTIVGWLYHTGRGWAVKCHACANGAPCADKSVMRERGFTPIWAVNILPYRQTCFGCKAPIVDGHPKWCELHTGEPDADL